MATIFYVPTQGTLSNSLNDPGVWVQIDPSFTLVLPQMLPGTYDHAIVTLNVPSPYATGNDFPGGSFAIGATKQGIFTPTASFSYESAQPQSFARRPLTLVVLVQLDATDATQVWAYWMTTRGSTIILDSPATLSAVLGVWAGNSELIATLNPELHRSKRRK